MTVYNDGPFVAEAIRSILGQSFSDFEFIIVDDGAVDDSVAQVQKFNDPRIRLIRQQNQGLAAALNRGIIEARGELIARQDADDVSVPDRIKREVQFLGEHPSVGLVSCDIHMIDEEGRFLREKRHPNTNEDLQKRLTVQGGNPFIHGAAMFRKSTVLQVGLYRPAFLRCQDYDLWLRIAEIAEVAIVPEFLYRWRFRHGSANVANWGRYNHYASLALACAMARRSGKPEPELVLNSVTRNWFVALTNRFRTVKDPNLMYELIDAQSLLLEGRSAESRRILMRAMRASPLTLYIWLLYGLAFLPTRAACRLWHLLRSFYQVGMWKK